MRPSSSARWDPPLAAVLRSPETGEPQRARAREGERSGAAKRPDVSHLAWVVDNSAKSFFTSLVVKYDRKSEHITRI